MEWNERFTLLTITCINFHVPFEGKETEKNGEFCGDLDKMWDEIVKYSMKIMIADVNAKVGRDDLYWPTVEDGRLLIDFVKEKICL